MEDLRNTEANGGELAPQRHRFPALRFPSLGNLNKTGRSSNFKQLSLVFFYPRKQHFIHNLQFMSMSKSIMFYR
jgi:hypothetical protein